MNRSSFLFACLAAVPVAACVVACNDSAPDATVAKDKPDMAAAPAVVNWQGTVSSVYNDNCSKCHGRGAEGGGAGTRSLLTFEKFDQKWDRPFFDAIKNGVKDAGMEPFGQTMNDAQVWSLVVHIRELQRAGLRQAYGSPQPTNGVYKSKHASFKIETVVEPTSKMSTPWSVDWLQDGRMLVTNRPGNMFVVKGNQITGDITGLPPVRDVGQGGLMDVAVHPTNGWIYLAFSDLAKSGENKGFTKVVRGKINWSGGNGRWIDQQTIFEMDQRFYSSSQIHFGCRIVFDGRGHVYFCTGERGSQEFAQDLTRPNGKVYRVMEDGSIPKDNPFASEADKAAGRLGAIWSYGHRNPQGLAFDLKGNLWDTEHAPRGGDEMNLIEKGANYGWPTVSFGINYNDSPFATPWPTPDQHINMPVLRWLPSIAACGLDAVRGNAFPAWKGDMVAGGLAGQCVQRVRIVDGKMVEDEEIIQGMGRVRDVVCGPDGFIYVVLNAPDKIIRLVPAK